MSDTQAIKGSLILALHARYEAVWEAYSRIADAAPGKRPLIDTPEDEEAHRDYCRAETAKDYLIRESDLIRQLVLLQVPSDDTELTVLVYHAVLLAELDKSVMKPGEEAALSDGLDHVFDYLMSERRAPCELGKDFGQAACSIFRKIRLRLATDDEIAELKPREAV
jgi:hypothetical protein